MINKVNIPMHEAMFVKSLKGTATVKRLPQVHKMVDVMSRGARVEYRMNLYEVATETTKMAVAFHDGMNKLIYNAADGKELMAFLKAEGFKTSKKFYMEDCGMTEELWNQWNSNDTECDM